MPGNTFGKAFSVTTFGESHGVALGGTVDGCPPGLPLNEADLQRDLDRRKPGTSKFTTQRREPDQVEILSGVFEGRTTGSPIGFIIRNEDQKSRDYDDIKDLYRPAHADLVYDAKYGFRDYRGGGRASARGTAIWVAAGAIARKYLNQTYDVVIQGCLLQVGHIKAERLDWQSATANPFFFPDEDKLQALEDLIEQLRREGDSIGARVMVRACRVPAGWGEPVFDKLDADIAKALMGINAVRGVEVGDGFAVVTQKGSEHRDEISPKGFLSNHAGGTLGGISSSQDVCAQIALKPTSSIRLPGQTIDTSGQPAEIVTKGRHDPCVGIRAVPIAEAMLALVLVDHALRQRSQNPSRDQVDPFVR